MLLQVFQCEFQCFLSPPNSFATMASDLVRPQDIIPVTLEAWSSFEFNSNLQSRELVVGTRAGN